MLLHGPAQPGSSKATVRKIFAPDDPIAREQLATMPWHCVHEPNASKTALSFFPDADAVSDFAISAMQWAVEKGIIKGEYNGFVPTGDALRVETATMLHRFQSIK